MKVLVLGAGGVGNVIAHELAGHQMVEELTVADANSDVARKVVARIGKGTAEKVDAADRTSVEQAVRGFDFVINALPPDFNESVLDAAEKAGAHYMDMASGTLLDKTVDEGVELALARGERFEAKGIIGLIDTGITPGITNVLIADLCSELEPPYAVSIYSYGLVKAKTKISLWSPITLLLDTAAEPLCYLEGQFRRAEPFEGQEEYDFPGIGPGTVVYHEHEEVSTIPRFIPGVISTEFRMGDPGILRTKALYEAGLLSKKPVQVKGVAISPLEFIAAMTPPTTTPEELDAKLRSGEVENGVASRLVEVEGQRDGERVTLRVVIVTPDLRTAFNEIWGANHVSYATGVSAAAFAMAIIEGRTQRRGVLPPELLEQPARAFVLERVRQRGLDFVRDERPAAAR